jgi:hypothetical protein
MRHNYAGDQGDYAVMVGRTTETDATGAQVEGVPTEMEGC